MITRTVPAVQIESWQEQLAHAITDPEELLELLKLPHTLLPELKAAGQSFSLQVPRAYLQRIQPGAINDPLLRQVLPTIAELLEAPGFSSDPLQESQHNPVPGVVHKYQGRALLIAASACAVNCRFCFRRHFPYSDNRLSRTQLEQAITYIKTDSSIEEVILSGGDPLANSDSRLEELVSALEQIPHLKRLRIHSRLPVVLPDRVSSRLLATLSNSTLQPILVIHCNHPNELDDSVFQVIARLRAAGITVLNQSVLLKGVNDNTDTLISLSEKLFRAGALPYYLHLLDPVAGAAHFDVNFTKATKLLSEMALRTSGYLVPKLARETAGAPAKITFAPEVTPSF